MWFLRPNVTFEDAILKILASIVIIFIIMPLHEYAHGFIAYKLGDNTAKYAKRLTLNPLSHIDPLGALGILLIGIGWAKPMPIDPANFKKPKLYTALTAIAGPLSNVLAAILGGLFFNGVFLFKDSMSNSLLNALALFFYYYIAINIALAVFNLIPLPPLDGSRILAAFLPNKVVDIYYKYQNHIQIILICLLLFGALSLPLSRLNTVILRFILWLTSLPFSTFGV